MIGYVAKDKDDRIYLHMKKPTYYDDDDLEGWYCGSDMIDITNKCPEFASMSYTDEPVKVEINIKRI